MKNFKSIITAILIFSVVSIGNAGSEKPMHEIHSMMIYNFIKYVQWPGYDSSQDFVIGVIGDDNVYETLTGWYNGNLRGGKKFKVVKFSSAQEVKGCHILYVGKKQSRAFDTIHQKLNGYPTLSITDGQGLASRGSAINFRIVNNKLAFELNQKAVDKANLKVSSQLAAMAILI